MDTMKQRRLQELDRSDFEIVKGDPDIRGWDVKSRTGQKIGSVEDLILDAKEKKVRYMIVDLDENELKLDHRKVLIPIGFAELDHDKDDVLIPKISVDQLCHLPDYNRNSLTPDVERRISSTLGRETQFVRYAPTAAEDQTTKAVKGAIDADDLDPDFYTHEHYNLDNLYKNRLHEVEPAKNKESEYERGLRLWERRSEGGIIDERNRDANESYEKIDEEQRNEIVKNRRSNYRQRRYKNEDA